MPRKSGIPLVLKIENWPAQDVAAWRECFIAGDEFDAKGRFVEWSAGTIRLRQQGYGQWLSFLLRKMPDLMDESPTARVTKSSVFAYLSECEERLSLRTQSALVMSLASVCMGFDPDDDWQWLWTAAHKLYDRSHPNELKPPIPISAADIFSWSLDRLASLERNPFPDVLEHAMRYREGLMTGFLIARPVRSRSLLAMNIGDHLLDSGQRFELRFGREDMKDKRARQYPFPPQLEPYMRRYLNKHRPTLLQGRKSCSLWISMRGNPFTHSSLASCLANQTSRVFGLALRPHAFRTIAATSISDLAPEQALIIKDILEHASTRMAERHYDRSQSSKAYDMLQKAYADLRRRDERAKRGRRLTAR